MSDLYQQLCNMLIRPTRQIYHLYDLGNPLLGTHGKRQDFQIKSHDNLKVKCSFYHSLLRGNNNSTARPTVIYLHSLNGSRLQFISNVEPLLKMGFNIGTLDLSGCGLSDGSYVTLGAHEKWDVLQLVKYIYKTYKECNFFIWGRSMGAVAAIKFYTLLQENRLLDRQLRGLHIMGLVLDSPFSSLNQLAIQIAKNRIKIPQIVIKMAFYMIQSSIETKANFKTSELELEEEVKKIQSPTLIITSKKDTLVPCEHSLLIYNNISSTDKQLMYIETEHNNNREARDVQKIYHFLKQKTKITSPRAAYYTGIGMIDKKFEKLCAKSKNKKKNLTLSKQKLNRNQSHRNQLIAYKNNNFFMSHVAQQNHIKIHEEMDGKINCKAREKSVQKVNVQEGIYPEISHNNVKQNWVNYSGDRPKVFFVKQIHQSLASDNKIQQNHKNYDLYSSKIGPVPQKFTQKPFTHSLSYKNIQCLKTLKKIKRLDNKVDANLNQQKQKFQQIKGHMNVITAKLKKKSRHILTNSFLPTQLVENSNHSMPQQNQKTLKKQANTKSSIIIQFSKQNNINVNQSNQRTLQKQKPSTPTCLSNRQISFSQSVPKPFTPQFPLHSSMRINQIQQRRLTSKEDALKKYSMQVINESNRGIKTTLNPKYTSINSYQNKNHSLIQSVAEQSEMPKPEFMSCKNMLSSQIISMRGDWNSQQGQQFLLPHKKPFLMTTEETSISLK